MKTKQQKEQELKEHLDSIKDAKTVLFTDYTGVKAEEITKLRREMRGNDAKFKVARKKLLRIAFEKQGLDFNPEDLEGQLGIIVTDKELTDIAAPTYNFGKTNETFKILGGFDISTKSAIDMDTINRIATLPSREVLLGQLVGMISSPIKMFMLTLNERAKTL